MPSRHCERTVGRSQRDASMPGASGYHQRERPWSIRSSLFERGTEVSDRPEVFAPNEIVISQSNRVMSESERSDVCGGKKISRRRVLPLLAVGYIL